MVKRKDIFNVFGGRDGVWDDRTQKYRLRSWADPVSPKRLFDSKIAPRCGAKGYQIHVNPWGPRPPPYVDAFVTFLEMYFTKEASKKIFDMAFSKCKLGWHNKMVWGLKRCTHCIQGSRDDDGRSL
jgi:hypothetical protein